VTSKALNKLLPKSVSLKTVWVGEQMEEEENGSRIYSVLKSFDLLNRFPSSNTSSMGLDVRVLSVTNLGTGDFLHGLLG
jgi:hypothetical protein